MRTDHTLEVWEDPSFPLATYDGICRTDGWSEIYENDMIDRQGRSRTHRFCIWDNGLL